MAIYTYTALSTRWEKERRTQLRIPPSMLKSNLGAASTILGTLGYPTILATHGYPTILGTRGYPTILGTHGYRTPI